ncbi:MAG TPA: IscS subfamily cysteine desulfurase, partial [Algoriphagus sp.]
MKYPIYLDYNATTPCTEEVMESMLPFFSIHFGNTASKSHPFGWVAENAVEEAREKIAQLIGAKSKEIIFTSGATEALNLAIKGTFEAFLPG